jgi:hypothetical protein
MSASLHLAAEQPLGIAVRDAPGLVFGELAEPVAVFAHQVVVLEPALVDPGVRADQEPVGVSAEQLAPFGRQLARSVGYSPFYSLDKVLETFKRNNVAGTLR